MAHKNNTSDFEFGPQPFGVTFIPERVGTWVIEIDDNIVAPSQFSYAIQALERANEGDTVQINLQCNGGSLGATDALIHAMRKCEAHIHIVATGGCHSSATLILLEAHSIELSSGFHALLHCGSLGNIGNLNEYREQAAFDAKFMPRILSEAYEGFLTEDELSRLLDGKDIWLDANEWQERHEKRNLFMQEKYLAQEEAAATIEAAPKPTPRAKKPQK